MAEFRNASTTWARFRSIAQLMFGQPKGFCPPFMTFLRARSKTSGRQSLKTGERC